MPAAFDHLLGYPRGVAAMALALLLFTLISLFDFTNQRPRFEVDPSMVALLPILGYDLAPYLIRLDHGAVDITSHRNDTTSILPVNAGVTVPEGVISHTQERHFCPAGGANE